MWALNKTPQGKAIIAKIMDRSDRCLAEHIRRAEAKGGLEAQGGSGDAAAVPAAPPTAPSTNLSPGSSVAASEFASFRPDEGAAANAKPPRAGADTWLRPSHTWLGPSPELPRLGPSHEPAEGAAAAPMKSSRHGLEPAIGPEPVDESTESPAPQGQARDEGMDLEVLEEEVLEKDLRAMLTVFKKDHRAEGERSHKDMATLVASMVQRGSKFRRKATRKMRAIVAEIYSAPRVTEAAARHARFGAIPGFGLDLAGCDDHGVRWDVNLQEQRDKAERLIDEQRPLLLLGSPMCTAFSNGQNINRARRDPEVVCAQLQRARLHLRWCVS